MIRSILVLALLATVLAVVPAPERVQACGIAYRDSEVEIANETALIVYDSSTKTEHFLRTAQFNTSSSDFGFFVPTPSQPELAEASAAIFPMLANITKPATVYRTKTQQAEFGCLPMSASKSAGATDEMSDKMPGAAPVRVIEKKRIGQFDAVVLKAVSAKALQDWLKENEYSTRPALEAWFDAYIKLNWYFAAFKIAAGNPNGSVNQAVRISFKTDTPIYPYREPKDSQAERKGYHQRLLRLFVLTDFRVDGTVVGTPDSAAWPFFDAVWSRPLDSRVLAPVLETGKFPPISRDLHITEFEDRSSPRKGSGDLVFTKSPNQDSLERPPHEIVTYETSYTQATIFAILFGSMPIVILIGALILFRKMKRAA